MRLAYVSTSVAFGNLRLSDKVAQFVIANMQMINSNFKDVIAAHCMKEEFAYM